MRNSTAVVIPIWKKDLTDIEEISLNQACLILKEFIFILVTYRKLNIEKYIKTLNDKNINYKIKYFNETNFESIESYNRMMLSIGFYSRFLMMKYVLIYQLDCFVFRNELDSWVEMNYSYIGAPWIKGQNLAQYGDEVLGGGNGGFSLRCVSHHIKALIIFNYIEKKYLLKKYSYKSNGNKSLKKLIFQNAFVIKNWLPNEDLFWGKAAKEKFSWFKVPEWEISSRFSVEVQPKYFHDLNNNVLPFGCHAWSRYDINFWKPFIEEFGYDLSCHEDDKSI